MIRSSTAFASLFALALAAGAAQAQAPRDGSAAALDGNVVGGGSASISGGGDDMALTARPGGAGAAGGVLSQSGRPARFAGTHGDGSLVEYLTPAVPADPGREAWLLGGGDNAEVVYDRRSR